MTTATVAWFSVNTFAGVDKLDLNISLAAQLKVSMENHGKDLEKYGKVITNEMIDDYLKNSPDRIPFGDWYETQDGSHHEFRARSVQGGCFILLI